MDKVGDHVEFYVGMFQPCDMGEVDRTMISINRLEGRRSDFSAPKKGWILDSGAFTRIMSGRGHLSIDEYAAHARRWSKIEGLRAVVCQDYMCEPFALAATGYNIAEHQLLTTVNYTHLREELAQDGIYVMPVIQGYSPEDYVKHTQALSHFLDKGAWVGLGSVCKRNASPAEVSRVLDAVFAVRPDLRLHGFGLKATALRHSQIATRIASADSMAWSFAGRYSENGSLSRSSEWANEWTAELLLASLIPGQPHLF